jgi:membrane-bound serine protease (ClpP class)
LVLAGTFLGLVGTTGVASAQTDDPGRVSVLKVEGLIDPVTADFIKRSIHDGEKAKVVAVVLQMDSGGTALDDEQMASLVDTIVDSTVKIAVWIGPNGSSATGGAAQIAGLADYLGITSKSRIGKTGVIPSSIEEHLQPAFAAAQDRLRTGTINEKEAKTLGIAPQEAEVLGDFLVDVPNFHTKIVTTKDGKKMREPTTVPVFSALPIQDQIFHTVASPAAAYLLLLVGLSLIVFELFTAGVGIAGLVGAGCFLLSSYGLSVLHARPLGIALLVLAIFGFTVDVQTGVPRVWSGIGTVALVAGSLLLFDGHDLSWVALGIGILGVPLFMIAGMPAMVRTRFSTPTIGRAWMIGEEGEAVTNVDPDGVVRVRGALWRARTNRATPLALHDAVRVVEVDGLLLEVEPLEGGARDHRERRGSGDDEAAEGDDAGAGTVLVDGEPLPPAAD